MSEPGPQIILLRIKEIMSSLPSHRVTTGALTIKTTTQRMMNEMNENERMTTDNRQHEKKPSGDLSGAPRKPNKQKMKPLELQNSAR